MMGGEEDNVSCDQEDGITSLAVRVQIGTGQAFVLPQSDGVRDHLGTS